MYPHFPANAIQASKYAVCKHGLHHEDKCGYAHQLRDVGMPTNYNEKMWYCKSHLASGPAGIDLFVGQSFASKQHDRVIQMLHAEGITCSPDWARMFAYFQGYGVVNEYVHDGDFGWYSRLEEYSTMIFKRSWSSMEDPVKQGTAVYPFPLATDGHSLTLSERMQRRMCDPMRFKGLRCVCAWSDVGYWYAENTSWHWGLRVTSISQSPLVRRIFSSVFLRIRRGIMSAATSSIC